MKKDEKITLKEFEQKVLKSEKKGEKFPGCINFSFEKGGKTLRAELVGTSEINFKYFDPYTLACIIDLKEKCMVTVAKVIFNVNQCEPINKMFDTRFEAFRRRVSFLNTNNPEIEFNIYKNNKKIRLDNTIDMFSNNRPSFEIIQTDISKKRNENKKRKNEKDLQTYLYNNGLGTNERFSMLGDDFYHSDGENFIIMREFCTGVFNTDEHNHTRILPRWWIDLVTINKDGNLAVIELKMDDSKIIILSQILNYALYFAFYRNKLMELEGVKKILDNNRQQKDIIYCYIANNSFHPRFNKILPFYIVKDKKCGFVIKVIVLKGTNDILKVITP